MIAAAAGVWWLWLLMAGLFAWWRIDIEAHPFRRCRRCKARGTNPGSRQDAFGLCKHGVRQPRLTAKRAAARHLKRRGIR